MLQSEPLVQVDWENQACHKRSLSTSKFKTASQTASYIEEREENLDVEEREKELAEWSERLTPGQSGWLGAAAVGSIPAFALYLFLQHLYFLLFLQRLYLSPRAVRSAAILFFVLRRFVLAASSLPLVSFPSFSLLPTPNRPCQFERTSKARHEADSFEPAEWSERLTPG